MKLFSDGVQDDDLNQSRPPSAETVFRPVGFEVKYVILQYLDHLRRRRYPKKVWHKKKQLSNWCLAR